MSQGTEIATSEGAEGPDDHELVPRPRAETVPVAGRHRAPDTTEVPVEDPETGETPRPSTDDAAAAIGSCLLGILALLLTLRPLVLGGDATSVETYVALGLAVMGLVTGIAGVRLPPRRVVAVVGLTLSALALLVVGIVPTL